MEKIKYNLSHLDCEVTEIYERRNLLTGRLDNYHKPYEIIFSFPVSMGERGFMRAMYYDELPKQQQVEKDARSVMRDFEKNAGNGAYYEEQAAKIIRKVLRKK